METAIVSRPVSGTQSSGAYLLDDGREATKKNELKPFRSKSWVIPPQQSAAFVYRMEQVLDVYERAYDPACPVVCLDESPRQLTECRTFTDKDGKQCHDSEYIRHGVRDLYMCYEPLAGKRYVEVEENLEPIFVVEVQPLYLGKGSSRLTRQAL